MKRQLILGAVIAIGIIGAMGGYAASQDSNGAPAKPPPAGVSSAKAQAWNYVEQQRLSASGRPVTSPATPPGSMEKGFVHGIFDSAQGPFASGQFFGTNSWASNPDASGLDTVVVAGSQPGSTSDPFNSTRSAAVFVYTDSESSPGPSTPVGIFAPSPDPAGQFTVTADNGTVLTLSLSGNSTSYYFDVATRSFQTAG
jgi:hypothetical protein